jgi:tetratricopeptide (TPR) repeat protein
MGNNEVIGPYGPGSVLSRASTNCSIIRLRSRALGARTGQLCNRIALSFRPDKDIPRSWSGIGMFSRNRFRAADPRLAVVYANFRRNVADLCTIAESAGAKVLLCTVSNNLRDCAPFASLHRAGLLPGEETAWNEAYREGTALAEKGMFAEAQACFDRAMAIDSSFAELRFYRGKCHLAAFDTSPALHEFTAARDLDALRFRADSRLNEVVREIAQRHNGNSVRLVDAERLLAGGPSGIAGSALFLEHVHFTSHGNYALASLLYPHVVSSLALPPTDGPLDQKSCEERLAYTPWDRYQTLSTIFLRLKRQPYSGQSDNARTVKILGDTINALKSLVAAQKASCAATYESALARTPAEWIIRQNFGYFLLESMDRPHQALEQYDCALARNPRSFIALSQRAVCLYYLQRDEDALKGFRDAIRADRYQIDLYLNAHACLMNLGKREEAGRMLLRAHRIDPYYPKLIPVLSAWYRSEGKNGLARAYLQKAIVAENSSAIARRELGSHCIMEAEYAAAVEALCAARLLDTNDLRILEYLALAWYRSGDRDSSLIYARKLVAKAPERPDYRISLGALLAEAGDTSGALREYDTLAARYPDDPEIRRTVQALTKR